ncbi:MAG: glycosyltransferase family 2 protein [Pelagibacteraceae bacterium]
MISIIIPTLNNLKYLQFCIKSIKKNSTFDNEIIVHVNKGEDGTLEFLKKENLKFTFTSYNAGICEGVNKASSKATTEYILYAHDDFYFAPEWDKIMLDEINKLTHNFFYFSGTMVQNGQVSLNCGNNIHNFDEDKFLENYKKIKFFDFQGSTWAPHIIHKEIWRKVGGFSEEFFPGTGSDPDLNKKLWDAGVRIFKGLQHCKVYHFGSIVTRQKEKKFNTQTESGSRGSKIFLIKWGISIKFFRKHFLKSDIPYCGPLKEPIKNYNFFFDLFLCKLYKLYLMISFKYENR